MNSWCSDITLTIIIVWPLSHLLQCIITLWITCRYSFDHIFNSSLFDLPFNIDKMRNRAQLIRTDDGLLMKEVSEVLHNCRLPYQTIFWRRAANWAFHEPQAYHGRNITSNIGYFTIALYRYFNWWALMTCRDLSFHRAASGMSKQRRRIFICIVLSPFSIHSARYTRWHASALHLIYHAMISLILAFHILYQSQYRRSLM